MRAIVRVRFDSGREIDVPMRWLIARPTTASSSDTTTIIATAPAIARYTCDTMLRCCRSTRTTSCSAAAARRFAVVSISATMRCMVASLASVRCFVATMRRADSASSATSGTTSCVRLSSPCPLATSATRNPFAASASSPTPVRISSSTCPSCSASALCAARWKLAVNSSMPPSTSADRYLIRAACCWKAVASSRRRRALRMRIAYGSTISASFVSSDWSDFETSASLAR